MTKIKISYTANNKYNNCPRSYYFHYIRKLREEKPSSALVFGGAMDDALNFLLKNKGNITEAKEVLKKAFLKTNYNGKWVDLTKLDNCKWFKSDLDKKVWSEDDHKLEAKGYAPEWITLYAKGRSMLDAYVDQVLPHLGEVNDIQKYVKIEDAEGNYIRGYIDFVATFKPDKTKENYNPDWENFRDKVIIFDNKTSSQKYTNESVQQSEQLGTYGEAELEYEVGGAGYIVIPKKFRLQKKPLIPIQIIVDKVNSDVLESIFEQYSKTINGHKYGDFSPKFENCKGNPFPCPYRFYCHNNSLEGLVEVTSNENPKKDVKNA